MRNPYVYDRPLNEQDLFIGRSAILDHIQRRLLEDDRLFLLFGRPHIGKTSLLNQLGTRLGNAYRIEIIPWPGLQHDTPLQTVLQALTTAVGVPNHDSATAAGEDPVAMACGYLAQIAGALEGTAILFCLDGVPLDDLKDIDAWSQAIDALHQALGEPFPISLILSIEARPAQMALSHDLIPHHVIERFSARETEDLLMKATRGEMTYDLDAVAQIHRFSGGEPYFVQLFGHVLFEERSRRGWVDVPEVAHATERIMELGSAQFEAHWRRSSWAVRIVLCVFGERVGTDGVVTAEDIGHYLRQLRVDIPVQDIEAALSELVSRDLLEMLGGRTYRFINGLFLRWLKREKDTLQTVRASRIYHQRRLEPSSGWSTREIDWLSVLLWVVAIALALGVAYLWKGRDRIVIWTNKPTPAPATLSAEGRTPSPLPTPQRGIAPGRIVYMSKSSAEDRWAIFVMRSDGTDPQQLTERRANDTSPSWSPDGKKLAFVSDRDGNREVYVMSADGSSQTNLTRHDAEDWTPVWSPDGAQIAFASFRDGNWELYKMNADGSSPQRLTRSPAADYAPAWSPDGERIAFVSDRSGNLDIWIMSSEGDNLTRFTDDPATDQSPAWSSDGQQLAWESYRTGNMELYVASIDGSDQRNLSQDAYADDHGVAWSPWGDHVAYYSNRDEGWDIFTLDLNNGERLNVTQSDAYEQAPQWGP